jgi:hypothetical protein
MFCTKFGRLNILNRSSFDETSYTKLTKWIHYYCSDHMTSDHIIQIITFKKFHLQFVIVISDALLVTQVAKYNWQFIFWLSVTSQINQMIKLLMITLLMITLLMNTLLMNTLLMNTLLIITLVVYSLPKKSHL